MPQVHRQPGFPSCVELSINFNEHAGVYESAEDWLKDNEVDWVSPEERQKAIDTDSIWSCQWYPITPIGFCKLAASDFNTLMNAVLAVH